MGSVTKGMDETLSLLVDWRSRQTKGETLPTLTMVARLQAAVVDCGTGYTKMGFAGNTKPAYIFPSGVAIKEKAGVGDKARQGVTKGIGDLDVYIGDEAESMAGYSLK